MLKYLKVWNIVSPMTRSHSKRLVLGIESTFDDSGAAVIDEDGKILGESLKSQVSQHARYGGVRPVVAMKLHQENIPLVVNEAMTRANIDFQDLSALATATRPGFSLSLAEGLKFSKQLVKTHNLPFIPVHHMEAHALTARSIERIDFPFLVLLASGGHCLLCLAQGLGNYKILGSALDEPPGAVFDKIARELKFVSEEKYIKKSGGQIIEELASLAQGAPIPFTIPLSKGLNSRTTSCNFSFSGLQTQALRRIEKLRQSSTLDEQTCYTLAASFQKALVQHMVNQVHRGIIFCRRKELLPSSFSLVISGGVSANSLFRKYLLELCETLGVKLVCPPRHLCTDNGIMIAWAGMEYLKEGIGIVENVDDVDFEAKSPIGQYIGGKVVRAKIILPKKSKDTDVG